MNKLINTLNLFGEGQVSLFVLVVNFCVVMVLAYVLRWHYIRFGHSLSNRRIFADIFPLLASTTFLVIAVVKSSLALSLGLVGALSIVRFRTPIKEPEELAYLFVCIAIGLGIGADQKAITVVIVLLILLAGSIYRFRSGKKQSHNLYLSVEVKKAHIGTSLFNEINRAIKHHVEIVDMRRLDFTESHLQGVYYISCNSDELVIKVIDELKKNIPESQVTFIDQDREVMG